MEIIICTISVFLYLSIVTVLALMVPINKKEELKQVETAVETDSVLLKLAQVSKTSNIPAVVDAIK